MAAVAAKTVISWTDHSGNDHDGPLITRADDYDVIGCEVCGFRHVIPLPEPGHLERAYRETRNSEEKLNFLGEDEEWAALSQRDRLDCLESLLPTHRRRLLDVGAGPGFFLQAAASRGWQVLGVEPSRQAVDHARSLGVEMAEGFFNAETAPTLGHFDVVHLNNVLEHVPNALEILCLARDLLTPGGLLCLNVPNEFTPFQQSARSALTLSEWWVSPPHHLNYFDFDSLSRLVTRLGFEVRERSTSFPMELFLLMGLDYTKDGELGRACHKQRKRFDLSLEQAGFKETRRAFYRALAAAGLGREAVVIAVKK
jgi:SAM-dependent methyltransferase